MRYVFIKDCEIEILKIDQKAIGKEGETQRDKITFEYADEICEAYPNTGLVPPELKRKKAKALLRFGSNQKTGDLKIQIIEVVVK